MKKLFKKNPALIIAIFLIIGAVSFVLVRSYNIKKYNNIINNGIETTATYVEGSHETTHTQMNVEYFSFEFEFFDNNGNIHIQRTKENYVDVHIRRLKNDPEITIKYDPETFEAVETTFGKGATTGGMEILIVLYVLAMGVVIAFAVVKVVRNFIEDKVLREGSEYLATFESYDKSSVSGGQINYKFRYSWTDILGVYHEGKSSRSYVLGDIRKFQELKGIKIKTLGKHSVILIDPKDITPSMISSSHSFYSYTSNNRDSQTFAHTKCPYCGELIDESNTNCASCGAKINK